MEAIDEIRELIADITRKSYKRPTEMQVRRCLFEDAFWEVQMNSGAFGVTRIPPFVPDWYNLFGVKVTPS